MQKQKSTPPWRSKLTPFQDEILTAWYQERATLKTIQSRLGKYGISITLSGISRFIRCRKNSTDPHKSPQPIKSAAPPKIRSPNSLKNPSLNWKPNGMRSKERINREKNSFLTYVFDF